LEAKVNEDKVVKVKTYDENDDTKLEKTVATMVSKNNNLILVTSPKHFIHDFAYHLNGPYNFKLRKIDLELNDQWERTIELGVISIFPMSIEEAENGDLIVSGTCVAADQSRLSGFVARFDAEGNLIKSHIFNLGQPHYMFAAKSLPAESYFFTGSIVNFGKGKEQEAKFYLKTDKDFNY
jgi:hypothetical protein